jgi:hypothetical protein
LRAATARRIRIAIPDLSVPVTAERWPWLALVALGFFHGINPAMGWLFAVALGLHRHSRKIVAMAWAPIAVGHAAAVAIVLAAVLALDLVFDAAVLGRAAGATLLLWALWHALRGHRQRLRVGMQTGLAGLALWSFLMSSAHGAGLMLVPALLSLCLSETSAGGSLAGGPIGVAVIGLAVHTAAMLATIAAVSVVVYEWVGLAVLRSAWINFDLIWVAALGTCGVLLISA